MMKFIYWSILILCCLITPAKAELQIDYEDVEDPLAEEILRSNLGGAPYHVLATVEDGALKFHIQPKEQ